MAAMKKKKKSPTLKERSVPLGMKLVQRVRSTSAGENAERSATARQRRRKAPGMGAPIQQTRALYGRRDFGRDVYVSVEGEAIMASQLAATDLCAVDTPCQLTNAAP